jgi:hypothetical protein
MKVLIENQGDTAIHILTDHDTVIELMLEGDEERESASEP